MDKIRLRSVSSGIDCSGRPCFNSEGSKSKFIMIYDFFIFGILYVVFSLISYQQWLIFISFYYKAKNWGQINLRMSAAITNEPASKHPLQSILHKSTKVISNDGRVFVGILQGLDQAMNCILSECEEFIYSQEADIRRQKLGIYFIRGDSIVAIGEYFPDQQADVGPVKAKPLPKCQ